MLVENKIGDNFDILAQRLIYEYLITYSKFTPTTINEASIEAQRQMHKFIGEVLTKIYNNPTLIGLIIEPDDYFAGGLYKDRPILNASMKKLEKDFLSFFGFLFELGELGVVKESKPYVSKSDKKILKNKLEQLINLGLSYEVTKDATIIYSEEYDELCSGWKLLCNACMRANGDNSKNAVVAQNIIRLMFMRCVFDKEHISYLHLYGELIQSGTYLKELEEYFLSNGYTLCFYDANFKLAKSYPDKQEGIFSILFNWRSNNQLKYNIRIPGFSKLINYYNHMDDELKELIFSRTGICSNCGYCTQTDKSGKRKPVAVRINYNGEVVNKCPLFPSLNWNELDKKSVSLIIKLHKFTEDTLYNKGVIRV